MCQWWVYIYDYNDNVNDNLILTVTVTVILIAMVIVIVKMIMMIKMIMVTGTTATKLRKVLVLWPEVTFSDHPLMSQVREFKIPRRLQRWNRRLKVYSRCIILYRDYSNSLALWNVGELSWGWSREATPHGKEMLKRNNNNNSIDKKGWCMDIFKVCLGFISLILFTPLGEMISPMKYALSRQLYFAYLAVFFTWVLGLTSNLGLMIEKMSLQKFLCITWLTQWRHLASL